MTGMVRAYSEQMDDALGETLDIHDLGFIRLVDYMGNDDSVVQMARVSYGNGTKSVNEDSALIRYLMRHDHTSPFEACEIKLHVKCPIFVARQWIRHRTASVNEYSGRYSVMANEFYFPNHEDIMGQSSTNKQGSGKEISDDVRGLVRTGMDTVMKGAFDIYDCMLKMGVAREMARTVLPLSTYTEFYWKIDLHNLLHFIRLRADEHAQEQIRVYAEAIEKIVKMWVPLTYDAYLNYRKNAVKFSHEEMQFIRQAVDVFGVHQIEQQLKEQGVKTKMSSGEVREFLNKLR